MSMVFQHDWGDLGLAEFGEEKQKRLAREGVRKIVHAEVLETPSRQNSTLVKQVAKRRKRLTLGALLLNGGEALSLPHHQSSTRSSAAMDPSTSSWPWATTMLVRRSPSSSSWW